MFKFERKKFFAGYRDHFGPLNQVLVDAQEPLIDEIEQDQRFEGAQDARTPRRKLAYCLATFKWETAHTMRPIDEYGSDSYFNKRYGPGTAVGKRLGNTQSGDGARFHGRGFVQLTGRANYKRAGDFLAVDLLTHPERAKELGYAYRIASEGMIEGWFTGKKLSHFFKDGALPDWVNARKIINGLDKAERIAEIARKFDEILVVALK